MFRLEERQLHILILLVLGASVLLFCLIGIERIPVLDDLGTTHGMADFSDGWICTYETEDREKLEEYYKSQGENFDEENRAVQEVNTFPAILPVIKGTPLVLFHRAPEIGQEIQYLLLETDRTAVQISIGEKIIYRSSEKENRIASYHLVPLKPEYNDEILKIELTGQSTEKMQVNAIHIGNRNQVWVHLLSADGAMAAVGCIFIGLALVMLLIYILMKNTWMQKRLLLFGSLEGIAFGGLFLMEGQLAVITTGWNYGLALLRACLIVIIGILHLMVMRCFVYKKKVLAFLDTGILVYCIFYISAMVLQGFSIMQFDTVYDIGKWLLAVCSLLYSIVMVVAVERYEQKQCKPAIIANVILLIGIAVQVAVQLLRIHQQSDNPWYFLIGLVVYIGFIWVIGLRQVLHVMPKEEENPYNEEELRGQILERLNPNLIFAAFHTLQGLIKNGSDNSIRMLYYISVYLRNNLTALEKAGEMIPFEEELEHMIAYLQLQKMRNTGLEFTFECKVKDFWVPRHSLEPIVEKAVKYGIAGKRNRGNIAIRTYLRTEGYAVQIIDDGVGFDKQLLKRENATALLNLLDMLEQTCQAQTEVISKEGKGTVITIVLPMLENEILDSVEEMEQTM